MFTTVIKSLVISVLITLILCEISYCDNNVNNESTTTTTATPTTTLVIKSTSPEIITTRTTIVTTPPDAAAAATNAITESTTRNNNDVTLPQRGSLQIFQNLGRAYTIPDGQEFLKFYENYKKNQIPEVVEIKSQNYPKPYPVGKSEIFKISVKDSNGIEIIIHDLNINPTADYLKLSIASDDDDDKTSNKNPQHTTIFTGTLKEPLLLRILSSTTIELEFKTTTKEPHKYRGFLITYKPYGEIPPPITGPPDVTIPFDKLETLSRRIVIDELKQNNDTWNEIKTILCNATNNFLMAERKIVLETCHPDNITFTAIHKCPINWPRSATCVNLNFAITLFEDRTEMTTENPWLGQGKPNQPEGLSGINLNKMWEKFGRGYMDANGYPEYKYPDSENDLFIWVGVSVGGLLVVFIILAAVFRTGILKNKWSVLEEDEMVDVKRQTQEIDISMFPSPNQVVPSLFPSNNNIAMGYDYYETDSRSSGITSNLNRNYSEITNTSGNSHGIGYSGNINAAFIGDDDEQEIIYRVRINGTNTDEAHT